MSEPKKGNFEKFGNDFGKMRVKKGEIGANEKLVRVKPG